MIVVMMHTRSRMIVVAIAICMVLRRHHDWFVPHVERAREAACRRVLVYVRIGRVEWRELDVVASAQQDRTRRREQEERARGAISDDCSTTKRHDAAFGARVYGHYALRRSDEKQRFATFLNRT